MQRRRGRGRLSVVTTWVLAAAALAASGADPGPPGRGDQESRDDQRQRVIVRVNRNLEIAGYLHDEDQDNIVVELPDGALDAYPKSRVLSIIRLVEPLPNQTGVVVLRNGQQRRGVVLEDTFDYVLLEIEGLQTKLRRDSVDYVILEPTFEQRYAQYKQALRDNMPIEHLDLCRWLIELHRYELARAELVELLNSAQMPEAHRLLTLVDAQLALEHSKRSRDEAPSPPADDGSPPEAAGALPDQIISYDDVNLIRVYEIDFDRPPKVSIDADTIRLMLERYGTDGRIPASRAERLALYRADPIDVAALLFELRARDLYPSIQVITEPWALNLFRRRVHNTWLLNNCATSQCHGGASAGRFYLYRDHYKDPRVRYTNLLILQRLELDPLWPLINYEDPMMSLIVQHGLPRTEARKPHPDVKGWKPVFGHGGTRMLEDTVRWIESMMAPRPQYPVQFDPRPPAERAPQQPPPPPVPAPGPEGDRTPR